VCVCVLLMQCSTYETQTVKRISLKKIQKLLYKVKVAWSTVFKSEPLDVRRVLSVLHAIMHLGVILIAYFSKLVIACRAKSNWGEGGIYRIFCQFFFYRRLNAIFKMGKW
jgi:hypothetical protein